MFRQRLWKSSSNPLLNHEYQLFKRCFTITVFRQCLNTDQGTSKLDLVKGRFKRCLKIQTVKNLFQSMNIHFRQIRRTLGIDLTHNSNTAMRTFDCVFA